MLNQLFFWQEEYRQCGTVGIFARLGDGLIGLPFPVILWYAASLLSKKGRFLRPLERSRVWNHRQNWPGGKRPA